SPLNGSVICRSFRMRRWSESSRSGIWSGASFRRNAKPSSISRSTSSAGESRHSGDHFQRSPGARRALEFEPGNTLDHHVVPQSEMTDREKTGDGYLDLNLFAGSDIARQRGAAQV